MLSLPTSLSLGAVALILVCKWFIYPTLLSHLAQLPTASPLAALSNHWIVYQQWQTSELKTLYAAHRTHGPIVRIGKNELSISSLQHLPLLNAVS